MEIFIRNLQAVLWPLGFIAIAVILGLSAYAVVLKMVTQIAKKTDTVLDDLLVKHCRGPARLIFPVMFFYFFLPLLKTSSEVLTFITRLFSVFLILALAWMLTKLTLVLEDFLLHQYRLDEL